MNYEIGMVFCYAVNAVAILLLGIIGLPWWLEEYNAIQEKAKEGYYPHAVKSALRTHRVLGGMLALAPVATLGLTLIAFPIYSL